MKKYFEKLYTKDKNSFFLALEENLKNNNKMFIVTANPEAFVFAKNDALMDEILSDSNTTVVPDGIGIVKGAEMLGFPICERIPGVEIAEELFKLGNNTEKSIFLFGAKQNVIDALCNVLNQKYPNLKIVGVSDGYCQDKDAVFEKIKKLSPDIVLVALGIPAQEKLIFKHLKDFNKGIFVGVGGSFDVLSGIKKRAPEIFIKCNLEWLYRILSEPKRIKRFYRSNVKFLLDIKKEK